MDADWIISPAGRRVLVHWADPRPAWLWSGDGGRLLWRNPAALLFGAKAKKSGIRRLPEAVPIKGQVPRLIRLGSPGRSSLSRIQFLAGERPISTTCTCTPLEAGREAVLLLVAVDAVDPALLEALEAPDRTVHALFPPGLGYLVSDDAGRLIAGSQEALGTLGREIADLPLSEPGATVTLTIEGHERAVTRLKASQGLASVFLIEGIEALPAPPPEPVHEPAEPLLPLGITPAAEDDAEAQPESPLDKSAADEPPQRDRSLTSLFDRLANDPELYAGLEPPASSDPEPEPVDTIGTLIEYDEPDAQAEAAPPAAPEAAAEEVVAEDVEDTPPAPPPDAETVERVSRYNFDELSRILNDRVAAEAPAVESRPAVPAAQPQGELVNLTGETFILNRLPLGILVFRDQQVLFANRAITEMIGYGSVEELRTAGLAAIFPGSGATEAGPVNHLVRRDGTLLPVTARLQSISWQRRPALMLSASATEVRTGHETAVRAFAELMAESREDGFLELNRTGVVALATARALLILGRKEEEVMGRPLSALLEPAETRRLQEFLERPARFAETARPTALLRTSEPGIDVLLFAQGQAGVITGYFGYVRQREGGALPAVAGSEPIEPALLARLSRGVRRPLNTIIGFADMIRSAALGTGSTERYAEYARDIKTAGQEIAALADELDDFVRLRDGHYAPRLTAIDLKGLLETCAARVRTQAGTARVLVRSAISERLPQVRADRASLGQAVLNLLASAIEQTPAGGSVILSAQRGEDGSITINVRDSGHPEPDPGDRFTVFRDGTGRDGEVLSPVRSSVGLALTRSLAAVNACALSVDPAGGGGTLFSLTIPAKAVVEATAVADRS